MTFSPLDPHGKPSAAQRSGGQTNMHDMDADDRALLQRAGHWPSQPRIADLSGRVLQQISAEQGIDFATALLYDRLLRNEALSEILAALSEAANPLPPPRDVLIGVVPGAFYKEYAFTGADGRRVLDAAHQRGVRAELIPLKSFGSLKDNAGILRAWVAGHADREICLVSLSKGGADVQFALTEPDAQRRFRNVSTWINLSGIVQGTALANWLLGQWWRTQMIRLFAWWRRYPFEVLHEIKREGNVRLENAFAWPGHLRVFHVIGFPLRRHLSHPWAGRAHRRLEALGPNDAGGILLGDAVRWPGTIIPLWAADHYLQDGRYDVAGLVMRLLNPAADGSRFGQRQTNAKAQAAEKEIA